MGDYSLVFTDCDMPIMSGLDAVTKIREFNPSIPICMMSGGRTNEVKPEAFKRGVTDYIDKDDLKLRDAIKSVISRYQ